jgi:hypothetical protein
MKPWSILAVVLILASSLATNGAQPASLSLGQASLVAKQLPRQAISIDKARRTLTLAGHLTSRRETNHCFLGFAGGTNGSRGGAGWFLIETEATPAEFHRALVDIGKRPGDNLTEKNQTECVKGDPLEVTLWWKGAPREYRLGEVVKASVPIQVRFGGNLSASERYGTGCLLCLTGCYIATTSNAALPLADMGKASFSFTSLAPPEGTPVRLTFR